MLPTCETTPLRPCHQHATLHRSAHVALGYIVIFHLSCPNSCIQDGTIALNAVQRRHARVSADDMVTITRFVPPEKFDLILLALELEFVKKGTKNEQVDAVVLSTQLKKKFMYQVFTVGQKVTFEFHGTNYILTVNRAVIEADGSQTNGIERGMICNDTYFVFEASNASGIKIMNQREAATRKIFKEKEFNLESLGIGGLNAEFVEIFRRAFAYRTYPLHVRNRIGAKNVKGILLYGPPGTGKTLMARQIGKMLNGKEPKIVNGPEVLSKFVGETEKNVRDLFADAENDQRTLGDDSELHVIIFDEIDAICKSRGSSRDGTGVHDSIVNQLLTKIDGVEALNNVLVIGMTNRMDMLDEALLRSGRLEVHIEIGLPDEAGRVQILHIHTKMMKENSFLAPDVNLQELAAQTKNYSGAELEGVVKSATSYALNRHLDIEDLSKPVDEENIKVTMDDFLQALREVKPAFGASPKALQNCRLMLYMYYRPKGFVDCGDRQNLIYQRIMFLVDQVSNETGPPVTCLLEGPSGSVIIWQLLLNFSGDDSELHVIIFDEIDAICKSRGSSSDGTGVHDSIVNQLLTKIDGVEALNNVLLIGMTNRKDMLDEALLRSGRLEVHIEIGLPDEAGRVEILHIHTKMIKENSFLAPDVNLQDLAAQTKNYSGAELEGVVKSATSYALFRHLNMEDLSKPVDEENIKITMEDFLQALREVMPAFGASPKALQNCRPKGFVDCGDRQNLIYKRIMFLVEQVSNETSPPVTCLLEGPSGSGKTALAATIGIDSNFPYVKIVSADTMAGLQESTKAARIAKVFEDAYKSPLSIVILDNIESFLASGKTALAATIGIDSNFPYVKIVSAETMAGLQESTKAARIAKVFEDAYKSPLSIVILDNIERLLEYTEIGPRFSNMILQTLLIYLNQLPKEGSKLLVLGTTSELNFLKAVGLRKAFSVTYYVPLLRTEDAKKVLKQLNVFSDDDMEEASKTLNDIPIKKLYFLIEMAAQRDGRSKETIYTRKEKLDLTHFFDCLEEVTEN
ncbi:hypothetical protein F2Q69_00034455 [Brassica cretica]|uniref:AAA+ ATPase domain-containing protein n=1 Tax=Brassica cretica TaxID=69181 RepID=A0A8S9SL52_BRACR|nr:hypothetical protein F2Q69_00034455 [Brassica cretica]